MTEFLRGIRVIKFNAWEDYFLSKINRIRENELGRLKAKKYLDAFCVYFWASTPILISVFTFITYVYLGNELTPSKVCRLIPIESYMDIDHSVVIVFSKVFTSLALFNMLIAPLNAFPWVINGLVQAIISLRRIQSYLNIDNLNWSQYYSLEGPPKSNENLLVDVDDVSFKLADNQDGFKLRNINFKLQKGSLIGIIGKVGCGKTSFLNALVGEVYIDELGYSGRVNISQDVLKNGFAYVTQDYWIEASTIKENILFGLDFDEDKYNRIVCK
jgi:ATP-binding cassette subfamily C (CFTR/MRP) protein 10